MGGYKMITSSSARAVVEEAERSGLTHKEIAKICRVQVGTVSRWKIKNSARQSAIVLLEKYLSPDGDKKLLEEASIEELMERIKQIGGFKRVLEEASLEEITERVRQLGFRVSFTDTKI
jgi:transposase